jgi:hypothetical protein
VGYSGTKKIAFTVNYKLVDKGIIIKGYHNQAAIIHHVLFFVKSLAGSSPTFK